MERLASQGIFSISISAHEIQWDNGAWNYDARGKLILKFLDKLRDWNDNGTDPFGGIFAGKLDLTRIALSGHSRGGEGVVAAQALNATWPTPHSIVAVNAIAPTDQNAVSYLMTAAPYYLLARGTATCPTCKGSAPMTGRSRTAPRTGSPRRWGGCTAPTTTTSTRCGRTPPRWAHPILGRGRWTTRQA